MFVAPETIAWDENYIDKAFSVDKVALTPITHSCESEPARKGLTRDRNRFNK